MDILKRALAPLTERAWDEIGDEAARTIRAALSARRVVDVEGPKGFAYGAVSLGRLDVPKKQPVDGVGFGIRQVLPLVEARARFELPIWELDNVERGADDIDLAAVTDAARRVARFEENAVYQGLAAAGIVGLAAASTHRSVSLGRDATVMPQIVAGAVLTLRDANVDGPYALVLGRGPFAAVEATCSGYPVRKTIEELLDGPVVYAPFVDGGFLVSTRGGDFELTLGQDATLGYETHDTQTVRLHITESFTFRVITPEAVIPFTVPSSGSGKRA